MESLKRFKKEFKTMLPPNHQKECKTVGDYFDLIKYCWECIGDVKQAIIDINYYRKESQYEMAEYQKSIKHLHIRIDECYVVLKQYGKEKSKVEVNVYTTKIGHRK